MNRLGFVRTCACAPRLKVADVQFNKTEIINSIIASKDAQIILFPELSLTGYTCGDLFQQEKLLNDCHQALADIAQYSNDRIVVVGFPLEFDSRLFNVAAVLSNGKIQCFVPKTYLPSYKEYYECRWFHTGSGMDSITKEGIPIVSNVIFEAQFGHLRFDFGVEICEDAWMPITPSSLMALDGATLILNPSASTETIGKSEYRRELISQNSARNVLSYLYAASGPTESTTDVVFSGHCIAAEYGSVISESSLYQRDGAMIFSDFDMEKLKNERRKLSTFGDQVEEFRLGKFGSKKAKRIVLRNDYGTSDDFEELYRNNDCLPFVPRNRESLDKRAKEVFDIQTNALMTRLEHRSTKNVVIGISGGLDSTLALLVAIKAFDVLGYDRKGIHGITMPGFGTTSKTKDNAKILMELLGITSIEISIEAACVQHFKDIGLDPSDRSITYENVQARERTQILFDYANKVGGMVIGTGDLSELALGWCTYNGDHMSMYSVNCSVPKTLVKFLVEWVSTRKEFKTSYEVLNSICNTTISPELLPPDEKGEIKQSTEESVGPYDLNDFFLYNHIRWNFTPQKIEFLAIDAFKGKYSNVFIHEWLVKFYKRFFAAQFKRSCVPDGPKVGSISLSPRGDWRMPSDASVEGWLS